MKPLLNAFLEFMVLVIMMTMAIMLIHKLAWVP